MNPDTCPVLLLSWLAWAFSVEIWDTTWSEDAKRQVLRDSVRLHRVKGTLGPVKRALANAGYGEAEIIERFGRDFHDGTALHDGTTVYVEPDHWAEYRIRLTRPITVGQAAQVRAILKSIAPARCHLKALDYTEALNTYNARVTHDGLHTHGVA
jgi:P2-related tail formation protein